MVKEMRVPSSSNSSSRSGQLIGYDSKRDRTRMRTNSDGLDLDAFLDVSAGGIFRFLVSEHRLAAECVDEGGPAWMRGMG